MIATHSLRTSPSLPSHRTIHHRRRHQTLTMMCRRRPSIANDSGRRSHFSASIPLPQSHIHRTPSELQLADDTLRAEYEDVRMCVRLVSGMRSQCLVSGYVHPRTMQSVRDILKTKRGQPGLLEHQEALPEHEEEEDKEEEGDWGLAYEEEDDCSAARTSTPCHPMRMMSSASSFLVKSPSDDSALSTTSSHAAVLHQNNDYSSISWNKENSSPEDDECVFRLEL